MNTAPLQQAAITALQKRIFHSASDSVGITGTVIATVLSNIENEEVSTKLEATSRVRGGAFCASTHPSCPISCSMIGSSGS